MLAVILIGCAIVLLHFLHRYSIRHLLPVDKMFPGPIALPFIGNAIQAFGSSKDIYRKIERYADQYKQTYRLWLGSKLYLMICNPREAEMIMGSTSHIDKATEYKFFSSWIGDGLLVSTGHKWRKHRKMLTPAFHFKILDTFIDVFNANGDILCEKLSCKAGGKAFNVYEFIKLYTLDNICETAMGTSINAQKCPDSAYVTAVRDACAAIFYKMMNVHLRIDFIFQLSKYGAMQRNAIKIIHDMTDEVIAKRKAEFENQKKLKKEGKEEEAELNMKERNAFLDTLLRSAEEYELTVEDIRAEVDTFMFEGHDTISSGISFALYLLAEHKDVQDKVFKELQDIFGDSDRNPTFRDLTDMKYLEQVIKESLRLYPSVAIIGRTMHEDLPIREGIYIPKGTEALIAITSIHRNPEVWSNPDKFDPDNFTPEAIQKRHPYAYVPFSAGPRNCIGQRFAMLEMKSALSKILRKFELLPSPDPADKPRVTPELVLSSENGIRIKIKTRELTNITAA